MEEERERERHGREEQLKSESDLWDYLVMARGKRNVGERGRKPEEKGKCGKRSFRRVKQILEREREREREKSCAKSEGGNKLVYLISGERKKNIRNKLVGQITELKTACYKLTN